MVHQPPLFTARSLHRIRHKVTPFLALPLYTYNLEAFEIRLKKFPFSFRYASQRAEILLSKPTRFTRSTMDSKVIAAGAPLAASEIRWEAQKIAQSDTESITLFRMSKNRTLLPWEQQRMVTNAIRFPVTNKPN